MKKIIKFIIIFLVLIIAILSPFIHEGYDMYKRALEEEPISKKVEEIKQKENYTKLEDLPKMYVNAVIAVEDHRFYQHGAIDLLSIGRAIVNDIKTMSFDEGGSTITQQLCKNIYFTQEKKIERKIAEIFMARRLEIECEKDEILELYVNTSYFGSGCYTIKDAANTYYNKEPSELTDGECIMLAGIPNAPAIYAPNANYELSMERKRQVINKMVEYGYLSQEDAEKIMKEN